MRAERYSLFVPTLQTQSAVSLKTANQKLCAKRNMLRFETKIAQRKKVSQDNEQSTSTPFCEAPLFEPVIECERY